MASSALKCPPFDFSAEYYEAAGAGRCIRQSSFFNDKAVLDQGIGYSVILGFGAFFAFFTSFLVSLLTLSSFDILILFSQLHPKQQFSSRTNHFHYYMIK